MYTYLLWGIFTTTQSSIKLKISPEQKKNSILPSVCHQAVVSHRTSTCTYYAPLQYCIHTGAHIHKNKKEKEISKTICSLWKIIALSLPWLLQYKCFTLYIRVCVCNVQTNGAPYNLSMFKIKGKKQKPWSGYTHSLICNLLLFC